MSLLAFCGFSQKCQEIMKQNQCAQKFTTGLRVFPAKQLFMGNVSLLQKQVWKVFKYFDEIIYNFRRFVWYTRCRTKHVKLLLMLFCFSACVTLPIFLIYQSIDFYYNTEVINFEAEEKNIHISHAFQMQVKTNQKWVTAPNYNYPFIAICHPKFFDNQRLKGKSQCMIFTIVWPKMQ